MIVIYTPGGRTDVTTWVAVLAPDSDGVLQVTRRERAPEIGEEIRIDLERKLGGPLP